MKRRPVIERDPIRLPSIPGGNDELWDVLIELSEFESTEWTLIGGQMVLMHALEHGEAPPRISTDLDVLVDVRVVTGGTGGFVAEIASRGFEMAGASPTGVAHRYTRGGVSIDVLAPESIGSRTDLTTTPPHRTISVPGGTQALARTQLLPVRTATRRGLVPRPSLLGALVVKAAAVGVADSPRAQREDFVFLLALVGDPIDLAGELTPKDRERIRSRSDLADGSDAAWRSLTPEQADRAMAALRILSNR
jgi:hypothetical protein